MKRLPTEQLLDQLIKNLLQDFLFYIPSSIIPKNILEDLKDTDVKHLLDNYLVIDIVNGLYQYESELFNERLLNKHSEFEKNLFALSEATQLINFKEQERLLNKYFEQFEFYASIAGWQNQESSSFKKHKGKHQLKAAFQMQSQYFKNHLLEFAHHFSDVHNFQIREEITGKEIIENYLPDLIARFGSNKSIEAIDKIDHSMKNESLEKGEKKTDSIKPKKSAPIITEQLSDIFILENVFNIKTP